MTRQITNCDVCSRCRVYRSRDRLEALWDIDRVLRKMQGMDCSGVDPMFLDQIVNALESAERALLVSE
jgi:hypothetical protein